MPEARGEAGGPVLVLVVLVVAHGREVDEGPGVAVERVAVAVVVAAVVVGGGGGDVGVVLALASGRSRLMVAGGGGKAYNGFKRCYVNE